jgi:hypothetical protein
MLRVLFRDATNDFPVLVAVRCLRSTDNDRTAVGAHWADHRARQDAVNLQPLPRTVANMNKGVNVIALVKGSERYIFLYDDESAPKMLQTLGKYAGDPELSFSWYDAAVLSQKVRKLKKDQAHSEGPAPHFPSMTRKPLFD